MTGEHAAERRRKMLHGRRKGPKLSAHQQHLLDHLLPQLSLKLERGRDPRAYFSNVDDVWLEVGFGGGEHLAWQAQHYPEVGIIGAEPYLNGVVKLLSRLEIELLPNIRIHSGDAREVIEALPEASIGRVFILFPDPWPKTRHHKRRFIQMETLDALARVMKPGSELRFASDDAGYAEWALERFWAHCVFEWGALRPSDWKLRPPDWPETRYEAKELHGKPVFLRFQRL